MAEYFLGMFPNEELSGIFTDSLYEKLEDNDTAGITKIQLHSAAAIIIKEIIEKNKLRDQALKDIIGLLPDSKNAAFKSCRNAESLVINQTSLMNH